MSLPNRGRLTLNNLAVLKLSPIFFVWRFHDPAEHEFNGLLAEMVFYFYFSLNR